MYSGIAKCEKKEPPPQHTPSFPRGLGGRLQLTSALRQDGKMYRYGN